MPFCALPRINSGLPQIGAASAGLYVPIAACPALGAAHSSFRLPISMIVQPPVVSAPHAKGGAISEPSAPPLLHWSEDDQPRSARWRSESGLPPPKRVVVADDRMTADSAYRLACEGTALLWRGDFQNARQLLQALARRADRPRKPSRQPPATPPTPATAFHLHRQAQSQRARTLGDAAAAARCRLRHPAAPRARRAAGLQRSLRRRPRTVPSSRCASCSA